MCPRFEIWLGMLRQLLRLLLVLDHLVSKARSCLLGLREMALRPCVSAEFWKNTRMTHQAKIWYVVAISIINVYYFSSWISAFSRHDNQEDRVNAFLGAWCIVQELFVLNSILFVLTSISLFVALSAHKSKARFLFAAINLIFLIYLAWTHL